MYVNRKYACDYNILYVVISMWILLISQFLHHLDQGKICIFSFFNPGLIYIYMNNIHWIWIWLIWWRVTIVIRSKGTFAIKKPLGRGWCGWIFKGEQVYVDDSEINAVPMVPLVIKSTWNGDFDQQRWKYKSR